MDENRHNDIDTIFTDSLQSHTDRPSDAVWERIENQLDKDDRLLYMSKFRRLLRVSACLLLLVMALGALTLIQYRRLQTVQQRGPGSDRALSVNNSPDYSGHFHDNKSKDQPPAARRDNHAGGGKITDSGVRELPPPVNYVLTHLQQKEQAGLWAGRSTASNEQKTAGAVFLTGATVLPPQKRDFSIDVETGRIPEFATNNRKQPVITLKPRVVNRLSLTTYFLKEFAGYNFSDNDVAAANGGEIEKKERNVFSASAGILVNYQFSRRWVMQSGLGYSWSSSIIDPSTSFAVNAGNGNVQYKVNTNSGYGFLPSSSSTPPNIGDSALTDNVYSNLHYLTVPLIASYKTSLGRFTVLAGAGVTLNFLTGATMETKLYGPSISPQETVVAMNGLKKINYGIMFKAELQYHFNSNWGITMIPCFKNTLSPVNLHSAVSAYPYNFGIGLGVNCRL